MRKFVLLIFAVLSWCLTALAQDRQVSGTVTSEDGSPLAGVTVVVEGTSTGVITNAQGRFSINAPQQGTLLLTFIGMEDAKEPIAGRSNVNVAMKSKTERIDDVIVIAYGTAKRESFTGSVGTVKGNDIVKRNTSSVSKALEGTVAGLQATSGSGQPGKDASIRVRGFGSMNASSTPLYVVDGMPYDGSLSAINPSDIESISVLKDASASALYGARGANGVIIITTRKGHAGESNVTLKAEYGLNYRALSEYETVDQWDYMSLGYTAHKNAYGSGTGYITSLGGERYNPFNVASDDLITDLNTGAVDRNARLKWSDNWMDELERSASTRQEYVLGINGGSDRTQYAISAGYLNEKGLIENTDFTRMSGRVNVDSQVKAWLKAGLSASFSSTSQNFGTEEGSAFRNAWYSAQMMGPIYPVYMKDASGKDVYDAQGNRLYDYGASRPFAANSNVVGLMNDDKMDDRMDNLGARAYMTYKTDRDIAVLKDLSFNVNVGFDYYGSREMTYYNPEYGDAAAFGGRLYRQNSRNMSYTFNQLINYNKTIGDHHIDLMAGHEYYDKEYSYVYGHVTGLGFPGIYELTIGSTAGENPLSNTLVYRIESYLSRLNYDFRDRYYFSASFRTDGSSRFNKDVRWGNFWSVGASWRMSEESWMQGLSWLDNLTLKASYGSQGNDDLLLTDGTSNYYAWQGLYSLSHNANAGGMFPNKIENKDLRWEKNDNFNTGIEASMFNRRLRVEAEYFHRKTTDMIMNRPMALSVGYTSYADNVGDMVNKGVDMTVSGTPVRTTDFSWDVTVMGSILHNEVTRLNDGLENLAPSTTYITKVGYPINSFYPALNAGVDPATGERQYKYYDQDGKEMITKSINDARAYRTDANILGSRIPDIYGSFTNSFSYKGIDLSFMFTYSVGGKMYDGAYFGMMDTKSWGMAKHRDLLRAWKNPGDVTDIPKVELGVTNEYSDFYLQDASYLALKNIVVGYSLPEAWVDRAGLQAVRLSITANNMFMLTKMKGLNPQYNFSGGSDFVYMPVGSISFGIDLRF